MPRSFLKLIKKGWGITPDDTLPTHLKCWMVNVKFWMIFNLTFEIYNSTLKNEGGNSSGSNTGKLGQSDTYDSNNMIFHKSLLAGLEGIFF